jgi:tetratricopeptide (TPR) repeat protein
MPSRKRKIDLEQDASYLPQDKELQASQQYAVLGIEHKSEDISHIATEPQDLALERNKRKSYQSLGSDEDQAKRIKSSKVDDKEIKQEVAQELRSKATQVEGYYSNDDVTILLDALLRRSGFERIRGGNEQDILRNLETGQNIKTMVLAPVAEDSGVAIERLGRDIDRAYRHNIEQILVPINIPNIHWYTIQLLILQSPDGHFLEAIIHDSLGIRRNSVVVEKLLAQCITVNKESEGSLPKIQGEGPRARNVYCGGYTARLIANLATNRGVIGEEAWSCPNNIDSFLRAEDASIVSEHNSANVGNFGRGALALREMMSASWNMSLLRSFVANEKEFHLLHELQVIYETIPIEIKTRVMSLNIPEAPAELYALVRDLYESLPMLKVLFQTNAQGEIEKDAEGMLKLDTNLEIEQIREIVIKLQRRCLELEGIVVAGIEDGKSGFGSQEPAYASNNHNLLYNTKLPYDLNIEYSNAKPVDKELEEIKEGLDKFAPLLKMMQTLYKGEHYDIEHSLNKAGLAYPDIAAFLNNAGLAYNELGDIKQALDHLKPALKMRQLCYQGDHPDVADSLNNVGILYWKLGNARKSLDYHKSALKMLQALHKGNHHYVVSSLDNVGLAYKKLKEYDKALEHLKPALEMKQSLYKGEHPDILTSLENVGNVYRKLGDIKTCLYYYEQALKMSYYIYKEEHHRTVTSLSNMGLVYIDLKDYKQALTYFEPALKMIQVLYKSRHPDVALSLDNVGLAYLGLKDLKKSLDYYKQALDVRLSLYNRYHPDVAVSLENVGNIYRKLEDYSTAITYLEPALKIKQPLSKGDDLDLAYSLSNVGNVYRKLGYAQQSLLCHEQALRIRQSFYKGAHLDVAASLNNVGLAYRKLGNMAESIRYLQSVLEMAQSLYEGNHPAIAISLDNVGLAYMELGDAHKSLEYHEQALSMNQLLYEGNHPAVAVSLNNVGLAHEKLGNANNGLSYKERATKMKQALMNIHKQDQDIFKGCGSMSYASNGCLEYYNVGLDQVLGLRLNSFGSNVNSMLLRSLYFAEGSSSIKDLAQSVRMLFSEVGAQVILVPVNVYNKHWLGLVFRKSGAVVEVTYMDSEGDIIVPGLKSEMEHGLALQGYGSQFSGASLEKQRYANCGYEVIENFVYYLTGTRATQEGAVYVHSLLVENSLLDPVEYKLKIEENTNLIGFLSNTVPLHIGSTRFRITAEPARASHSTAITIDLLPAINEFNSLWTKWLHYKLLAINSMIHKATIVFKGLDVSVDFAKLLYEPNAVNSKKLALDSSYLYGMYTGVNGYSTFVSGIDVVYQMYFGRYQKAFNVGATTLSAMSLPYILAMSNRPYLRLIYGAYITIHTMYAAIKNLYDFVQELMSDDSALRSAIAYKELASWLAVSPLQAVYDFEAQATSRKLQLNNMLFEKEKATIKAQLEGEFAHKVFDWIYLPQLLEKYSSMKDVIEDTLTADGAEALKIERITITSADHHYDHCMEIKNIENSYNADSKHYYCYNDEQQLLEHIFIGNNNHLEVLERL